MQRATDEIIPPCLVVSSERLVGEDINTLRHVGILLVWSDALLLDNRAKGLYRPCVDLGVIQVERRAHQRADVELDVWNPGFVLEDGAVPVEAPHGDLSPAFSKSVGGKS